MAAGLQLESSGVTDLRQKFYELLLQFSTFPAAQNFFLVQIHGLPGYVLEANVDELGLRPGTGQSTGLNLAKKQVFEPFFGGGNNWMFLATGVDLTTETTSVNNKGTLINGLLPVGPFMESREYPDNNLDIQFSETNISIIDTLFRSWIQLYSVYGNINVPLSTDVTIYFIAKQKSSLRDSPISTQPIGPGNSTMEAAAEADASQAGLSNNISPVVTKIYTYKDCIPYVIKSANVGQYDGDVQLGSVAVGWRFSKYDVRIPVYSNPSADSPTNRPEFDPNMNLSNLDPNAPYPSSIIGGNVGEGSGYEETERTDKIIRTDEYKDKMVKDFIGYDSLKKRADLLQQRVEQRKQEEQLAERDAFGAQWAGGVRDKLFDEHMNKVQQPFDHGQARDFTAPSSEVPEQYQELVKRNAFGLVEPDPSLKPFFGDEKLYDKDMREIGGSGSVHDPDTGKSTPKSTPRGLQIQGYRRPTPEEEAQRKFEKEVGDNIGFDAPIPPG